MSIICPNCSHANPDQSSFCVKCGNRFSTMDQVGPAPSNLPLPSYYPAQAPTPPPYSPPANQPYESPSNLSWQAPASPSFPPASSAPSSPSPSQWASTPAAPSAYPAQMGTGQGLASIRRAFAGHGTLIMHHSWLLDGKQTQAISVLTAIRDMLAQRNYAGLNVRPERLTERGILMEERDYLKVGRGASTVFIYVAPAGNDLYISRATTALPVISYARVAIVALLFFVLIFGFAALTSINSSPLGPALGFASAGWVIDLLVVLFYPLLLFFIVMLVRSFINWMIEKDFLVYLRPSTLNDFQLDDIALLEHSTDRIVKDAVEQLGLDASNIVPPPQGYQPKRRIRTI